MPKLSSLVDPRSEAFQANAAHNRALVEELRAKFDEIEPLLKRYPAIDPATFRSAVVEFCDEAEGGSGQ